MKKANPKSIPVSGDERALMCLMATNGIAPAAATTTRVGPHISVFIGIGRNHTAEIIMPNDAYQALINRVCCGDETA